MVGHHLRAAVIAVAFLAGCKKDDAPQVVVPETGRRVYVLCEGQYQVPNAALTVFLPERDSVYPDAFGAANAPQWGDVAQSLFFTAAEIFICVNNSDRILVADRATFKLKHVIPIRKPRYIQRLSDDAAIVSTLYSNTLFKISLKDFAVVDSLKIPRKNPEGMTVQNGLLYVCPWDAAADKIYVVADGSRVVDSIAVGPAPHTIELDKNGRAWVLSGNATSGASAQLTRVALAAKTVEASYAFPPAADPIRISFNATRDTFYYIGVDYSGGTSYNGVYRMDIGATAMPATPFIPAVANQYFWAVGVDPRTHLIYVGDPRGFTQQGVVRQYTAEGTLRKEFTVGIGPNSFYFD